MNLLNLFFTASEAVLKLILVTAVGAILALDRIDILGEDARKHFNNVVFYVLNPALIATNLAGTITFESMVKLWFMPLNIFITFVVGSAMGWIIIRITRVPLHLRGVILGCCAAGNMGNMLLIIIPEICKGKGSLFGAPDVCYTEGMAYTSLTMAIAVIYMWTYVYHIVRVSSSKSTKEVEASVQINSPTEEAPNPESCIEAPVPLKDRSISISEDSVVKGSNEKIEVTIFVKFKQSLRKLARKINLKMLFAPSTIAAVVGFLVGVIPQIRRLMIGESAPLRVIQDSASLLGDGTIPIISLVMGGNLTKGLKGSGIGISVIIGIIVVRYILLPLFGIFIVKGATHFGLIHSDPLYRFVLLLQFAMPPAINIGTITQLFGAGESECSVIMLWTYALASVSLTLWSILFMWLVS